MSMKKSWVVVSVVVLVVGGLLVGQRDLWAAFAWDYFGSDTVALALNKSNPNLPMQIGLCYFGGTCRYDLDMAEIAFKKALEADETAWTAHYQLGRIAFIKGEFGDAISYLNRELELHPEFLRALYIRGLVYGYRDYPGDLARAEEDFKGFVEWAPEEWAGYNDLAWIQTRMEKFEDAAATVRRGFEAVGWVKNGNPWLYSTLGTAEMNSGNYEEAKEAFLTARKWAEQVNAEYFLSAYPGNDSRNAQELYEQYLATLAFNLGITYEGLGDSTAAIEEYERYLTMIPEGPYPQRTDVEEKIRELAVE